MATAIALHNVDQWVFFSTRIGVAGPGESETMLRFLSMLAVACAATAAQGEEAQPATPLRRAHAHNDYEHERPLLDAVSHGFRSVEADVWLVEGSLLVAHDREDVQPHRTLQSLYLNPLRRLVAAGAVQRFTLMIDFKSAGAPTYRALAEVLQGYDEILTKVTGGDVRTGPVSIVISGDRPVDLIAGEEVRYVGVDGRPGDLDSDAPAHLMPWISTSWGSLFTWRGEGTMPSEERRRLHEFVAAAHEKDRVVRFWATPETEAMWRELLAADVDLLNTDRLADLQAFLSQHDQE